MIIKSKFIKICRNLKYSKWVSKLKGFMEEDYLLLKVKNLLLFMIGKLKYMLDVLMLVHHLKTCIGVKVEKKLYLH